MKTQSLDKSNNLSKIKHLSNWQFRGLITELLSLHPEFKRIELVRLGGNKDNSNSSPISYFDYNFKHTHTLIYTQPTPFPSFEPLAC